MRERDRQSRGKSVEYVRVMSAHQQSAARRYQRVAWRARPIRDLAHATLSGVFFDDQSHLRYKHLRYRHAASGVCKRPQSRRLREGHEAAKDGRIKGFLCDAMVTLEGIKVDDRAEVFGSTTLASHMAREGPETIHLDLRTEQPLRSPLHPKQAERFGAEIGRAHV